MCNISEWPDTLKKFCICCKILKSVQQFFDNMYKRVNGCFDMRQVIDGRC